MHKVVLYPFLTEKAQNALTRNVVVFCVDLRAGKKEIKEEVEQLFEVKVEKVNTLIRPDGRKVAYVKLSPEFKAEDLAIELGIV